MENQDKNIQPNENELNSQSPAEKTADELLSEMENQSEENIPADAKSSFEELEEMNDRYLRLVAEFDNFKKRNAKERMEWMKSAGQDVILSVLPTLDDFNRAMKQMETSNDVASARDGVLLIYNKLLSTLESRGLKQIDSVGMEFNPEQHEAITEIPAPSEDMIGKVVDEIEKGFTLNDKMLRYAKVVVGK